MLFRDWLEAQYKSGRLYRNEIEKEVDKLRKEIDKGIEPKFMEVINEEFWNLL